VIIIYTIFSSSNYLKMPGKILITILIILTGLITFLLWPLKSKDFTINWDDAALKEKREFLQSIQKASPTDTLPNIVLILVDDLGLYDMSFYGGDKVETPHMDGIGRSGAAFNQAYVAAPMCSASRAAILTGRYPQRFGFEFQMHDRYLKNRLEYLGFKLFIASDLWRPKPMGKVPRKTDIERQGLPPSEISIADMLKARGYATAIIGKWHTGSHPANLPVNFGFDYQYGFFDAHSLYAPEGTMGITDQRITDDFTDQYNWKRGRKNTNGIFRNYESIEEKEHLTDAITRESIAFIRQHKEGPFFLFAAYNAPHTPLQAPDEYVALFKDEPDPVKRVYYAMIKQLDDAIGRLLGELGRQEILENTLVIFLSDNGGATYTYTTDNGRLRGGKITDFEGGTRVPFFISWPGKIGSGSLLRSPVSAMDIYPTIAAAAGCPLPTARQIDGKDLQLYINNDSMAPHSELFWQRGDSRAMRSGDWKVIWNAETGDTLMFNISDDPNEINDLFELKKGLATDLISKHDNWSETLHKPLWPPVVHFREMVNGRWVYFDN
jgi:arylsulfatase A-like enzyme